MIETETISPFGEIRSALDIMHQDVVKVDNIVKNTGLLPSMETLVKNTVKTQMAGSFDVIRGELANVIKTADANTQSLPLWEAPKPKPVPAPVAPEPAAPAPAEPAVEPAAEPRPGHHRGRRGRRHHQHPIFPDAEENPRAEGDPR